MTSRTDSPQPILSLTAIHTYQRFINTSRAHFLRTVQSGEPSFEEIMRLNDDMHLRLEYYKHIHRFRKEVREACKAPSMPTHNRTFDFSLTVRNGRQWKEYDFVDRQRGELMIVLQRMKEQIE